MGRFRRRRYRRRRTRIARYVVPPMRIVKFRATDFLTLTSTAAAFTSHNPYVNGIIDPFAGSGTGQPLYLNEMKSHYRSAVCVGSKITVQFHNDSSTVPIVVGLYRYPYDVAATSWTYEYLREAAFPGRQRILTSDIDIVTLSMKTSCKRYFGVTNMLDNNEFLVDLENETECTKLGNYTCFIQSLNTTTAPTGSAQLIITMEYIVVLKDPFTPARS